MTLGYISGSEGSSAVGSTTFALGPGILDYGYKLADITAKVGTIAMTTGTSAVTGTGTAFTTDYAVGDWINIAGMTTDLQIKTITSATAMVTMGLADATVTVAVHKKVDLLECGKTGEITVTYAEKKTELKSIQTGDNAADRSKTGFDASIKTTLAEASLARMAKLSSSTQLHRNAVSGEIDGAAIVFNGYELDSSVWKPLYITLQEGVIRSANPLKEFKAHRAVAMFDGDLMKLDATSQKMLPVTFNCYQSDLVYNGGGVVFSMGVLA